MLNWLAEHPDEKPDAEWVLLTLAHAVLHMLRPEARYEDFTTHDLCSTAIDLGFNFTLHPSLKVKPGDINWTLIRLTSGLDKELLKFNTLLGDIHIDV